MPFSSPPPRVAATWNYRRAFERLFQLRLPHQRMLRLSTSRWMSSDSSESQLGERMMNFEEYRKLKRSLKWNVGVAGIPMGCIAVGISSMANLHFMLHIFDTLLPLEEITPIIGMDPIVFAAVCGAASGMVGFILGGAFFNAVWKMVSKLPEAAKNEKGIEQEPGEEEEEKPTFSVTMSCHKTLYDVKCSFDYTNNAQEDYYLLKRNTPLDGFISSCITVSHEGNPLEYKGMIVYRKAPNLKEFVLVKSGETVSASVKLNDLFIFNSDGHYTITYNGPLKCVSKDNMKAQSVGAKMSEVEVEESTTLLMDNTVLLSRPCRR
uniref:Presequence translocated-associated motor subunit PAM17, mitochondrial n=1 Tax=Amphimedon queenslandica TaxID=400682 RepID=A0A1X7TRM0_AMPQE